MRQGGRDYAYLYDGKGNVTALLDSLQTVAGAYAYDPFGRVMKKAGTINQPYMFSTKEYDPETGLSYYGFRYNNASIGKWITRDPIEEEGGINLYGFNKNSAINYIDPNGEGPYSLGACAILIFGDAILSGNSFYEKQKEVEELRNQKKELDKKCEDSNITAKQWEKYQKQIEDINSQIREKTHEKLKDSAIGLTIGAAIGYACKVLVPYGP